MILKDLIVAVKEKNLSKDQLEDYREQLSGLYADMQIEMAELEKAGALFFEEYRENHKEYATDSPKTIYPTDISIKRKWQASEKGQRLLLLKRYCLATKELLNSLKSRLYSIY